MTPGIGIGMGIGFVFLIFFTLGGGSPPREKKSRKTKPMPMPMPMPGVIYFLDDALPFRRCVIYLRFQSDKYPRFGPNYFQVVAV